VTELKAKLLRYSRDEDRGFGSPCRVWGRSLNNANYGNTSWAGLMLCVHRAAWIAWRGPIPFGAYVLHNCHQRDCLNVNHLRLGTQGENMADAISRGTVVTPRKEAVI
jgi:hypothetical protein